MRKKPAETRGKEAAADRTPSDASTAVNVLVAGIPTPTLLEMIQSRYPGKLNLYVAECRPYEMQVARAIAAFPSRGIGVSILTDNMMAALIETVPIHAVWSQYLETDGEHAVAINAAHLAAFLAQTYGIPCILYPISALPAGESGRFAGEDITVPGAAYIAWEPDIVPLELIGEVIEHGSGDS
jgi:methylthioribose-1-phosphate isomerase